MKNMCKVYQYSFRIQDIDSKLYNSSLKKISSVRKEKIQKYHFNEDKIRCLMSEIILRYALYKEYDISTELEFKYNQFGKPHLAYINNIHFSISHSGDWVICALANNELGVDVEEICKPLPSWLHIFSEVEQRMIRNWNSFDKHELFYKFWTLKESYAKAIGAGLNIPMNLFSIQFYDNQIILSLNEKQCDEYSFVSKKIDQNHYTALCVHSPEIMKKEKRCLCEELLVFCS